MWGFRTLKLEEREGRGFQGWERNRVAERGRVEERQRSREGGTAGRETERRRGGDDKERPVNELI